MSNELAKVPHVYVNPEATTQELAKAILEYQMNHATLFEQQKLIEEKIEANREAQRANLSALIVRIGTNGLVKVDGEVMHVHNKWLKPIQIHE